MTSAEFPTLMREGREALARGDHRSAYARFTEAHDVGHAELAQHLAAHRGRARAALRAGRIDRVASNLLLAAAAAVFDRRTGRTSPRATVAEQTPSTGSRSARRDT